MPNQLKIRPEISSISQNAAMAEEERFQNETLRPVIKMQHDLLLAYFRNYLKNKKAQYFQLSAEKKAAYVNSVLDKDLQLRNIFKGMILGQFSLEEYQKFCENPSEMGRRLFNIIRERILTNLHELELS